ncbi:protocadherin-15 [Plakobranchus ocellatus]|uniref:Protocadherin-15 n=1 Tax=Plakobranchus ocellatus TaxID=259542 RepID=A0AAV3YLR8_9GAST|nr:protocadherin-15 [Plakobranchus ocellatus]
MPDEYQVPDMVSNMPHEYPVPDMVSNRPGEYSVPDMISNKPGGWAFVDMIQIGQMSIRSTVTQVIINVLPVNDHAPVFVSPVKPVVLDIAETTQPGTVVVTVKAEDLDGDPIQYSIQPGGDADLYFSIDSNTGEIILVAPVNLDTKDTSSPLTPLSIILLVEAKDNLVHTTLLDVTVNFLFVNEFPPVFDPTSTAVVFENATVGQRIATVTATDNDSGPDGDVAYSLLESDVPPDMFFIHPDTGTISLACSGCLDFDIRNFYTLVIKAEDGRGEKKTRCFLMQIKLHLLILFLPQ